MAASSRQTMQGKEIFHVAPMTPEEEDTLVHNRITNDERPLRRVTKKFHTYASVAYAPLTPPPPSTTTSVEEVREAFRVELESFKTLLRKSRMVYDAERRQAEVYRLEKERIANEHGILQQQIDQLKAGLEHAQMERRRKLEYDQIAEKINSLPSREELESSIAALESDIAIIQSEQDVQTQSLLKRKDTLDTIVADIAELRLLGKGGIPRAPRADRIAAGSKLAAGVNARADSEAAASTSGKEGSSALARAVSGEVTDIDGDDNADADAEMDDGHTTDKDTSAILNPSATPFTPQLHGASPTPSQDVSQSRPRHRQHLLVAGMRDTPLSSRDVSPSPSPQTPQEGEADAGANTDVQMHDEGETEGERETEGVIDKREEGEEGEESEEEEGEEGEEIEVGEVAERTRNAHSRGRKLQVEDREEGEASDESSELSDPPEL